jgi:lysophospholipase L1-like esterase
VSKFLDVPVNSSIFLDGYSGLDYERIFEDPDRYLRKMKAHSIDVLILDLGSNDLCNPRCTPSNVVEKAFAFLELLHSFEIRPKIVIFFAVIQRTCITRANQVPLTTFVRRAKRFNKLLAQRIKHCGSNVHLFSQININNPKYVLDDGSHLNPAGIKLYSHNIRQLIVKYSKLD